MRRVLPLLIWLAGEIAVVVALHRLGRVPGMSVPLDDLPRWLRRSDPQDAIAATLRVVALVGAWWQLAATSLYCVARTVRARRAVGVLRRVTLPVARRCADRAIALSLVASAALATASSASAAPADPPVVDVRTGRAASPPPSGVATPAPAPPVTAVWPRPTVHVVVAGENLWTIAAAHLATSTGRSVATLSEAEIAPYWARVCDANRARVRSGDLDVIYPGEAIELPAV